MPSAIAFRAGLYFAGAADARAGEGQRPQQREGFSLHRLRCGDVGVSVFLFRVHAVDVNLDSNLPPAFVGTTES